MGGYGGNSGYSSGGYVTYDHGENAQAAAPAKKAVAEHATPTDAEKKAVATACPSLVAYITAACGTAGSCTGKVNAKGIAIGASRDPTAKEVAAICTEFRRTAGGCANAASNKILTKGCPATKHATPTMETATTTSLSAAHVGIAVAACCCALVGAFMAVRRFRAHKNGAQVTALGESLTEEAAYNSI